MKLLKKFQVFRRLFAKDQPRKEKKNCLKKKKILITKINKTLFLFQMIIH